MTFSMPCPECAADVEDIEATVASGSRIEHFWGAPVRLEESECEIDAMPKCPECGRKTIADEEAVEFYWSRVA